VSTSPPSVNAIVNQAFQVGISVSGVSDLYGWEFKLGYNTSLLELVRVTEGSFLNSSRDTYFVPKNLSVNGYVLAGCTSLKNVAGASGNGTLATLEFRARTLGSCTLDLYETKLANSAKQLMEHSESDGTVTVSGCVVVRVQYKDGSPRSNADVYEIWPDEPPNEIWLGVSDRGGYVESRGVLDPGINYLEAFYGGSVFGPDEVYLYVDENGDGSVTITANYEITPPAIFVLSPQNLTYVNNSVPLTFTVYDFSSIPWIGYSLDNQPNATLIENITLAGLSEGFHSVVVYANDTFGNMGASERVDFAVSTHDVAVVNVVPLKAIVGQGSTMIVNVTVENNGLHAETFSVTAYANTTVISIREVTLDSGDSTVITLTWNTTAFPRGNYTISVVADTVQYEMHSEDNTHIDGTIRVGIPGDVDPADGYVGIDDIFAIAQHFGQEPWHPDWNSVYDIAGDDYVGIDDIFIAAQHFGQEEP